MRLSEEQYELLEAYLRNELSAADQASFENEIRADAELLAEVNRQRELRLGLRALGIQQALQQARNQYQASMTPATPLDQPSATVRPLRSWRYWAAAASVVVLSGIGYYTYQQSASQQTELAYTESFRSGDALKGLPTTGVPAQTLTTFQDALRNYKAGNYDRTIEQLRTLPVDKQTVAYKNYLSGLSYLANKQPANAIPLLLKARQTPSSALHQKADWFLALAYVKNNDKGRALPILKQISTDSTHPFQSLAQRVLKKIQ
ncbi:hypothetical protein GCM10027347_26000 [Larkinella harenae]